MPALLLLGKVQRKVLFHWDSWKISLCISDSRIKNSKCPFPQSNLAARLQNSVQVPWDILGGKKAWNAKRYNGIHRHPGCWRDHCLWETGGRHWLGKIYCPGLTEKMGSTQSAGQIRGSFIIQHWAAPPPPQIPWQSADQAQGQPSEQDLDKDKGRGYVRKELKSVLLALTYTILFLNT